MEMETEYHVNILNLPNEILLRIFRFVPTYDLLKNLALVNNRFYKLTKDNSVIESFDIENRCQSQKYENGFKHLWHLASGNI